MTRYKERMKLIDSKGDKYIITEICIKPTPVGDTIFYRLKSRKKKGLDRFYTEWMLSEYFKAEL